MAAIKVVTAIWGDYCGRGDDYVRAIRAQVPKITVLGRDRQLLDTGSYRGWWSKCEVFRPENRDLRPCLFVDLDTIILGSLRPFHDLDDSSLWLIRDFFHPHKSNSGLFVAPDSELSDQIWRDSRYVDTLTYGRGPGDGEFLSRYPHQILNDAVDGIRSYKADQRYDAPGDARVLCFHGRPKPHEADGWAGEYFARQSRSDSDA